MFETNNKAIWKTEPTYTPWLSGEEGTVELLKEWKTEMESQRRSLFQFVSITKKRFLFVQIDLDSQYKPYVVLTPSQCHMQWSDLNYQDKKKKVKVHSKMLALSNLITDYIWNCNN